LKRGFITFYRSRLNIYRKVRHIQISELRKEEVLSEKLTQVLGDLCGFFHTNTKVIMTNIVVPFYWLVSHSILVKHHSSQSKWIDFKCWFCQWLSIWPSVKYWNSKPHIHYV
jgi:hypothetical protein